jgi:3-hexulose-6-phosphate synthase/6-phospho-3-hexuloisomerase
VHIVNAHVGIDQQMSGKSPLDVLSEIRSGISVPLAAAGGLDAATAPQAAAAGADIVIVGSAVTKSADVAASARAVRAALDGPALTRGERPSPESAVREILSSVSTPNISDAMHRKGAMAGIVPVCRDARMVGRAVTVQGFAGDWAKPVEAVDIAEPGDVLVISNDGVTHVACWGELATMSAMQRGLSGVVIDGAARDIDDIRRLGFPVFSRAVAPNAGEPKGFGEINAEVRCGGQLVRPGDWIAGDASGVVVVPRERAAEIARRALEVKKTEERIREEIRRGGTLSQVSDLIRWEKK